MSVYTALQLVPSFQYIPDIQYIPGREVVSHLKCHTSHCHCLKTLSISRQRNCPLSFIEVDCITLSAHIVRYTYATYPLKIFTHRVKLS